MFDTIVARSRSAGVCTGHVFGHRSRSMMIISFDVCCGKTLRRVASYAASRRTFLARLD